MRRVTGKKHSPSMLGGWVGEGSYKSRELAWLSPSRLPRLCVTVSPMLPPRCRRRWDFTDEVLLARNDNDDSDDELTTNGTTGGLPPPTTTFDSFDDLPPRDFVWKRQPTLLSWCERIPPPQPPPQPFYGPFSGSTRVSRCQKRTWLYGARED